MKRLSTKEYWDSVYTVGTAHCESTSLPDNQPSRWGRLKLGIKKLLGEKTLEYMKSYDDHLLVNVILKTHLSEISGARVLEIGSAPGDRLIKFSRAFDCIPYGVEYSEVGVELNRKAFILHHLNPENVIHADFFSDEFQCQYKESFDIVFSMGFAEHFSDVKTVIDKHIDLLPTGGRLVLSIPNFRGVNFLLARVLHRELLAIHNLNIMDREEFAKLFDQQRLTPLFCGYYGTFSFYLVEPPRHSPMRSILIGLMKLQPILNLFFRLVFKDKGAESRFFSPYLLFIGVKT